MEEAVTLRASFENDGSAWTLGLFEDNGCPLGECPWTDLLEGQTTLRIEWSRTGVTWSGVDVDLSPDAHGRPWLRWNPPAAIADGTEYGVRFVIAGVTYGPITVRLYR